MILKEEEEEENTDFIKSERKDISYQGLQELNDNQYIFYRI